MLMDNKDYIYCKDCKMFVDFWKYGYNIINTDHEDCQWRYVTDEELIGCVEDCEAMGCFNE
jgi:hypothetical protein